MVLMKHCKRLIALLILIFSVFGLLYFVKIWMPNQKALEYQNSIQSFYNTTGMTYSQVPGTLLKTEPMNIVVPGGGTAYRILYVSELPDGQPAISSGMIFISNLPAPSEGRKVVAWAHGTLGFGNECVPSRSQDSLSDTDNWLDSMMQRGWVVVATDYVGLGTTGMPYYLIGQSEAYDVINSVRAARNFEVANVGNEFVAWGHSQGGHSALFTGVYASTYAPELNLIAVAAAAPAAELIALFSEQYDNSVAWAIGPDASVSWPLVYSDLPLQSVLSKNGLKDYQKLAYGCVMKEIGDIEIKSVFKEKFFEVNPMNNIAWYQAANDQTPPITKINVPIYIAQGLDDTVVLPNTTALFIKNACNANKNITVNWLGDITHTKVAVVAGPAVTDWIQDRFNNVPATNTCSQVSPVTSAIEPSLPAN